MSILNGGGPGTGVHGRGGDTARVVWLRDGEVWDYQMDPGETGQQM